MTIKDYYKEFEQHLLEDEQPSIFFKTLIKEQKFPKEQPFNLLLKLKTIQQSKKYHPEGSVFNHTMLVIDYASKIKKYSNDKQVFMWSSLLHDIGKITTTRVRKGRITAYDHDKEGEVLVGKFLTFLTDDFKMIKNVKCMVRWHMQPLFAAKNLPYLKLNDMINDVDFLEIALFSICDRLGRGNLEQKIIQEQKTHVLKFIEVCKNTVDEIDEDRVEQITLIVKNINKDLEYMLV